MNSRSDVKTIASVAQLLALVLIVCALYFARDVFIPLALGLLLSFLLSPLVNRLERLGLPNVWAVIMTAALAFVLLAGGFTILGRELTRFVSDLPQYKDELVTKARTFAGMTSGMGGSLDQLAEEMTEAIEKGGETQPAADESLAKSNEESGSASNSEKVRQWAVNLFAETGDPAETQIHDGTTPKTPLYFKHVDEDLPLATWATTAGSVLSPLATAGLVSVFALFMLIHRENLRDRIIAVVSHGNYVTTTEALDEVARRISRYLVAQTIINTSYGMVLTGGLLCIGLTMTSDGVFPNAVLWGVLATCLRFVPYIGPFVSAGFPLTISLAVFPGYQVFLAVAVLIVTMELISNNIIEPWLYGTSTGISAVAVIVAAVFWGWLWGPVGLLLSTPLTVCLVVLGRHVRRFRILTTLLGEDVQIKPSLKFYQRLLASDQHRAKEMLMPYVREQRVDALCDEVLIPALKRIRIDHDADELTDESHASLIESIHGLIEDIAWDREKPTTDDESKHEMSSPVIVPPLVVGCPSHDATESVVLRVMQAARGDGWWMNRLDEDFVPSEIVQVIASQNPVVALIMVLPKGGFAQARFLCRTLRREGYDGPIVVACMGKFKHFDRLFVRFRKADATSMTTSFKQTRSKIDSLVRRHQSSPPGRLPKPVQSPETPLENITAGSS